MAGAILYRQTVTLTASASSVAVTLDHTLADANYSIGVAPPYQTSFWITSKAADGFTLNVGTTNGYDQTFEFLILHE